MSCVILLLQSWPMWEIPEIPFTQGRPKGSPLWESIFFNGNSSINLKVSMGTSSINGGLSIATFDDQSVHHIWFPWSLFPTKTYSEKLKKKTKQQHETMCGSNHVIFYIYSEHVFRAPVFMDGRTK